jgi:hypothetical protein
MTFMRLKAEDQAVLPFWTDLGPHGDHPANRGVAILERKANLTGKGSNGFVYGQIRGCLATIEQQLSTRANR